MLQMTCLTFLMTVSDLSVDVFDEDEHVCFACRRMPETQYLLSVHMFYHTQAVEWDDVNHIMHCGRGFEWLGA